VTAEIPGVEASDLDISVHNNTLTLRGSVSPEKAEEGRKYHRRERAGGSFARSWQLPFEVDREKVDAKLTNGVLELTLPRSVKDKPKKIQVKS
jgi:HSP20 family protein